MGLLNRLTGIFQRNRLERDLNDELQLHLELKTRENIEAGMTPEEARRSALITFGGVEQKKEQCRDADRLQFIEELLQDVRYGLRQLRRNPFLSAAVITIAGLGIAASCVVFTFADAAIFGALPYTNISRLARAGITDVRNSTDWIGVPVPVFLNWQEHATKVGRFAASFSPFIGKTLVGGAEPAQVFEKQVSKGSFQLLGARPILGRDFLASDYKTGGTQAVILSYSLWKQLFNGRPDVLGQSITLDGVAHIVVGVMPADFLLPGASAMETPVCWTPLTFNAKQRSAATNFSLDVWVRLNRRVSSKRAQAVLSMLALQNLNPLEARRSSEWRIRVTPLVQQMVAHWRSALTFLLGAVAFLLAIACANVANLLLARARTRQKEIAVRAAIGATRARVVRQLLTESLVLGGLAGALGILLSHWGTQMETRILPHSLQTANFEQMGLDPRILLVTLAVSVIVGIAFGIAPALYASKVDLVKSLKEGGPDGTQSRSGWNLQNLLVVAEVALSLILLIGAALMLRSFLKLEGVQPGFNAQQLLSLRVFLPRDQYPKTDDHIAAYQRLLRKIQILPGVRAAGFVTPLPLAGINVTTGIQAQPGMSNVSLGKKLDVGFHAVSPAYFDAMGIPLLQGRLFTEQDTSRSEKVAIVDKAFADRYWPGEDPIGKVLYTHYPKLTPVVYVVGEVGSIRDLALADKPRPEIYNPFTQHFRSTLAGSLVVRTSMPARTAFAMERAIHSVDPEAPVSQIENMRQVVSRSLAERRLYLVLVGVFAVLALLLTAAGVASTVFYAVSRRKHEVGIRMALGAGRLAVLVLLMGQSVRLVLIGIVLGAAGSLLLTRFIASQLYGVGSTDPITFLSVAAFLGIVSVFASAIPASRATSVDPVEALRTF